MATQSGRTLGRWLVGLLGLVLWVGDAPPVARAPDDALLAYFRQAKINWRQAEGQKLTIGLNKHPFTESLLPLIPCSTTRAPSSSPRCGST
jgi:hypothetical protein